MIDTLKQLMDLIGSVLTPIVAWINVAVNAPGRLLTGFMNAVPGWLSNTIISAVAGVVLLVMFKYTSNQKAIGKVRDGIKANMLALKLFKDSIGVTLKSQGQVFKGAFLLLFHSIRPMVFMIVPVVLLFAQLALYYQFRPMMPGEEALVTLELNGDADEPMPNVRLVPSEAVEVVTGPVRVFSKREIVWKVQAKQAGLSDLSFQVAEQRVGKQLAVGNGFMRVSPKRPGWKWLDILTNPEEVPFAGDSAVRSISIEYPPRDSWTSGTNWWVLYFFVASMAFALIVKPFFKVRI